MIGKWMGLYKRNDSAKDLKTLRHWDMCEWDLLLGYALGCRFKKERVGSSLPTCLLHPHITPPPSPVCNLLALIRDTCA